MSSAGSASPAESGEPRRRELGHSYFYKVTSAISPEEATDGDIRKTELFGLLKPFLIYVQIFGAFFVNDPNGDGIVAAPSRRKSRLPHHFWKIYSIVTITVLTGAIAYFPMIMITYIRSEYYEFVTAFMATFLFIFLIECTMLAILFHYHCSKDSFGKLFRKYPWLAESESDKRKLNRFVRFTTLVVLTMTAGFLAIAISGWLLIMYRGLSGTTDSKFTGSALIRFYPSPDLEILFNYYTYIGFHVMLPWTAWAAFFLIMCLTIWYSLETFSDHIMDASRRLNREPVSDMTSVFDVDHFRVRHRRIVNFVHELSELVGAYLFIFYLFSISEVCMVVYFMLFFCSDGVDKIVQAFWAIGGSSFVFFMSGIAAMVNVSYADRWETNTKGLVKIALFGKVTSGPEVAISAMGFFSLTREFALGIIGSCISMFFLLLNLSPARDFCEIQINATEISVDVNRPGEGY